MANGLLYNIISPFQDLHQEVRFEIEVQNEYTNFMNSEFDFSFRLSVTLEDSSTLVAHPIIKTGGSLYASRQYLEKRSRPSSIAELSGHRCINFKASRLMQSWPYAVNQQKQRFTKDWEVSSNQTSLILDFAKRGAGLALIPDAFVPDEVVNQLEKVDLSVEFPVLTLNFVYKKNRFSTTIFNSFKEHLMHLRLTL